MQNQNFRPLSPPKIFRRLLWMVPNFKNCGLDLTDAFEFPLFFFLSFHAHCLTSFHGLIHFYLCISDIIILIAEWVQRQYKKPGWWRKVRNKGQWRKQKELDPDGKGTSMYYVSMFWRFLTPLPPPLSSNVSIWHDPP